MSWAYEATLRMHKERTTFNDAFYQSVCQYVCPSVASNAIVS